ncbi:MAG: hypothetical protein HeimC3_37780 [Candidatus Heimdallarchaeota archaeon LC_3]|nr:MAG: hypothetical protein HeimC3_50610 [Candidatus Heimdallarchaeota archaeon LC_3]OLS21029.1 MAG: hypothetical protein HeimC3_37780 [Candidatus Heimdallarchaeota archaeon LC_3]
MKAIIAYYEYYFSLAELTKAKENINDFYEPDYQQISIKKNDARQLYRVAEKIHFLLIVLLVSQKSYN